MFREPAQTVHDRRPLTVDAQPASAPDQPTDPRMESLRQIVEAVMLPHAERPADTLRPDDIEGGMLVLMMRDARPIVRFEGDLLIDSETAYDQLDAQLKPLGITPVLREAPSTQSHHIYLIEGRTQPTRTGWVWNLVLLIATLFSVLYVGKLLGFNEQFAALAETDPFAAGQLFARFQTGAWYDDLQLGIPYAVAILLILGAHELGHYFAARRRKHAASLPFFIPFPFGIFGTFGAFIQLREPMRNRKTLLEVGAAGPLAGLVFAIPILFIGLATSQTGPISPGGITEGNSLFYALAKFLVFGQFLPSGGVDVFVNSLAWAGWTGLFVTGLNLLPLGQLDGGHVVYALLGERAKRFYWPTVIAVGILTLLTGGSLLFIFVMLLLFGRIHAVPLDNVTPLPPRHRWVAIGTLVVFALVFVPVPLSVSAGGGAGELSGGAEVALIMAMVISVAQRLRRG
ncbi:MAG: site-2 protease family protein [Anaerolineae bacterium]|jgi:hypothetical protein|nr:site-2 protease family protein [Anaerolineae bacterium]